MDRLFLDADVLFSAAYREDSGLRRLWELEDVELLTSAYGLEEARRNLDIEDQVRRLDELPESADGLSDRVEPAEKHVPILQAAVAAEASHLRKADRKHIGRLWAAFWTKSSGSLGREPKGIFYDEETLMADELVPIGHPRLVRREGPEWKSLPEIVVAAGPAAETAWGDFFDGKLANSPRGPRTTSPSDVF